MPEDKYGTRVGLYDLSEVETEQYIYTEKGETVLHRFTLETARIVTGFFKLKKVVDRDIVITNFQLVVVDRVGAKDYRVVRTPYEEMKELELVDQQSGLYVFWKGRGDFTLKLGKYAKQIYQEILMIMEQRDKRSSVFPYDVAISFAEEDRNIAVALEANFKLKNIKAYYYPESGAETLGHELGERLSTLYKEEAEYVVLILSQHYLNKQFCQLEMKAILERLGESEDRCLVLITTDDKTAEDIGLAKDFARIRWKHNPREVADLIWEMLGKPESEEVKEIDQTTKKSTFNVQAGTIKNNVSADTVHGGIHFGKDNS